MTIITVKEGVMAADSLVLDGTAVVGGVMKVAVVPGDLGGGFVGFSGNLAESATAIKQVTTTGKCERSERVSSIWLKPNGDVFINEGGGFYFTYAPFHAIGSGFEVALGAMCFGASAREAVEVACKLDVRCGGDVRTFSIMP